MLLSYTCTSEKEIIRSATTTEVYFCSPLQARYLPRSCLIVSQRTLTRASYQRVSVDSGKSAGPPTWCLLQGSCKRNVRSRTLTTNGVKQGCVLAPTLFSLVFSAMLTAAFRDGDVGIDLRYRTDGKLFNLRRLQAKTKVNTDIIRDFLFADECALNAGSEADMQRSVDKFSIACTNFGLTISIKKTEVLHQPAPGKPYVEPNITVNAQRLSAVNRFTYLGSTLSQNATIRQTTCQCSLP